jgi:hypothetical protein
MIFFVVAALQMSYVFTLLFLSESLTVFRGTQFEKQCSKPLSKCDICISFTFENHLHLTFSKYQLGFIIRTLLVHLDIFV